MSEVEKFAIDLLKARHVGVREFREELSRLIKSDDIIITLNGKPKQVMVPRERMIALMGEYASHCKMLNLVEGASK